MEQHLASNGARPPPTPHDVLDTSLTYNQRSRTGRRLHILRNSFDVTTLPWATTAAAPAGVQTLPAAFKGSWVIKHSRSHRKIGWRQPTCNNQQPRVQLIRTACGVASLPSSASGAPVHPVQNWGALAWRRGPTSAVRRPFSHSQNPDAWRGTRSWHARSPSGWRTPVAIPRSGGKRKRNTTHHDCVWGAKHARSKRGAHPT